MTRPWTQTRRQRPALKELGAAQEAPAPWAHMAMLTVGWMREALPFQEMEGGREEDQERLESSCKAMMKSLQVPVAQKSGRGHSD